MNVNSINSVILIAIVASSAEFFSANGAAIDSPEFHFIKNGTATSDESAEGRRVTAQRIQRAASFESIENYSTQSLESHELLIPRPIPIKQPRGCNVTLNLEDVSTDVVCDSWPGRRKGAPFVKECDCNWGIFHNCLCILKSGWVICLKDCKQLLRNVTIEASRSL